MGYFGGIPGVAIWLTHILIGSLLIYTGYQIVNDNPIHKIIGIVIASLGSLVVLYHGYLWFKFSKK